MKKKNPRPRRLLGSLITVPRILTLKHKMLKSLAHKKCSCIGPMKPRNITQPKEANPMNYLIDIMDEEGEESVSDSFLRSSYKNFHDFIEALQDRLLDLEEMNEEETLDIENF